MRLLPGDEMVDCYVCWPHTDGDCECDYCDLTGLVLATDRHRSLLVLVRSGATLAAAEAEVPWNGPAQPPRCGLCRGLVERSGLCPACVETNRSVVSS